MAIAVCLCSIDNVLRLLYNVGRKGGNTYVFEIVDY